MNKLNVGARLAILVVAPLAIILLLVISSLSSFSVINQGVGRIYDDRVVPLTQLKGMMDGYTTIINAINKADNGLVNPDEALAELEQGQNTIRENWKQYTHGRLNDDENKAVEATELLFPDANTIITEASEILARMGNTLQFDEDGDTLITDYNGDLFEYVDPIAEQIATLIELQLEIAKAERQAAQEVYDNAFSWSITVGVISAILLGAFGFWVSRTISVPLNELRRLIEKVDRDKDLTVKVTIDQTDEIGQVAQAFQRMMDRFHDIIQDVGNTSIQLQNFATTLSNNTELTREGVAVQTRETDQVATATTEMTHAIEEVNRSAQQAAEAATEANNETNEGSQVLETAIRSINSLSERIHNASDVINRVATDSSAIGSVLDVIRGIAEQTNLLALNAAIEAARAGEQGRGFAVVADEVRSLAQRTQESTQEIQQMIERLQGGTQDAVKSMAQGTEEMKRTVHEAEKAGASLTAISSAVAMITDMNNHIATATDEQMSVSQEISRNVVNISDVAKSSEHSVEEVDRASTELKESANRLAQMVGEFRT
ncbi:methyl-accepting chemotaxis protein [Oceanicoccus sp. KOV_DT_Chl]|uniref:methyl-accepting chemotaxis protein n=1 Tax=Oceanicoccus sp. KOV_DT_Chl TaxID=1904639 RepID=UPI000C79A0DD|nr:methyl-accepting chemotaxis protein [Oceanicoccus sp. KOV_DT_Chl]